MAGYPSNSSCYKCADLIVRASETLISSRTNPTQVDNVAVVARAGASGAGSGVPSKEGGNSCMFRKTVIIMLRFVDMVLGY